ncbi:MAG TPA: hypothetical protein VK453_28605 [Micromonosporaceae bacterium]|nr:hypothetical protein [Micromonosporaceae bacterium]
MRSLGLIVGGALLMLAGAVWTLQGIGALGGSPMSGVTMWAVIGPLTAAAGLVLLVVGVRARGRGTPT